MNPQAQVQDQDTGPRNQDQEQNSKRQDLDQG